MDVAEDALGRQIDRSRERSFIVDLEQNSNIRFRWYVEVE